MKVKFQYTDFEIEQEVNELQKHLKEINVFNIKCKEELYIRELLNRIDKAVEYLNQPYRDNFDYSKARLVEILGDKE